MFELEKNKPKKIKSFTSYLSKRTRALSTIRASTVTAGQVKEFTYQNLRTGPLYLKILVPYLDNPYEEIISESIQIKEEYEKTKFRNEEFRMLQQKHFKP